jgi:transposase
MPVLYVGIDVSSRDLVVCSMNTKGKQIGKFQTFKNALPDAEKLAKQIATNAKKIKADEILIGTESTSVYDLHIVDFLASDKVLNQFDLSVFRINAKLIRNFKKAYTQDNKTDPEDSFVIADRLRFGRLPEPYTANQMHLPLQRLTRYRLHIVDSIRRETQYFLVHLFLKYNRFGNMKIFSNTMGTTSISIINDFTCEELSDMSLEDITNFIIQKSKNRIKDPDATAQALRRAIRESYRLRPTLAKSVDIILASTYRTIRALKESLKQLNKAIQQEFEAFPNTLTSVNGIGTIFAAGIYAEIGDISRFASDSKLAKYAGLTWKITQSGNFKAEETRLTGKGNSYLRYYLVEAANSLRVHNEEYKAYYNKKYHEVPKHKHKRALVLSARKLVRLIFGLLSKKQLYDKSL